MSIDKVRKTGSLALSLVIAILVVKVFWGQPLVISGLCSLTGLATGLMISKKRTQ